MPRITGAHHTSFTVANLEDIIDQLFGLRVAFAAHGPAILVLHLCPAGFELRTWVALFAPRGMPKPTIERIGAGVAKALAEPEVRERFAGFGFEPWIAPPADISKVIETDTRRFAEIVKRARIALD